MIKSSTLNNGANRVWVLGDLHFGVRANSVEWLEIQMEFFEIQSSSIIIQTQLHGFQ